MGGSFRDKLVSYGIVKQDSQLASKHRVIGRVPGGIAALSALKGWELVDDFVYRRIEAVAIDRLTGMYPGASSCIGLDNDWLLGFKRFVGYLLDKRVDGEGSNLEIVFFDTETTGLSSGAGSVVFLLGLFKLRIPQFSLEFEQVFLGDFPGEHDFLRYIKPIIEGADFLVSFNGRGFDSHILKSRFILNGLTYSMPEHIDLLHISRRLWRGIIGGCSLRHLETYVMGMEREGDVSGFEIPDLYFRFLREGRFDWVKGIVNHNRLDVFSLFVLLSVVMKVLSFKESDCYGKMEFDRLKVGEFLLMRGLDSRDRKYGEKLLLSAFRSGSTEAGRILSLYYKRINRWDMAVDIWEKMALKKSLFASVELAKYYEHKRKMYDKALNYVDEILYDSLAISDYDRDSLIYRRRRLKNKLSL